MVSFGFIDYCLPLLCRSKKVKYLIGSLFGGSLIFAILKKFKIKDPRNVFLTHFDITLMFLMSFLTKSRKIKPREIQFRQNLDPVEVNYRFPRVPLG